MPTQRLASHDCVFCGAHEREHAIGARIADLGEDTARDALIRFEGTWISSVTLDSHPGAPLLRVLHPRCDAVIVQSL